MSGVTRLRAMLLSLALAGPAYAAPLPATIAGAYALPDGTPKVSAIFQGAAPGTSMPTLCPRTSASR